MQMYCHVWGNIHSFKYFLILTIIWIVNLTMALIWMNLYADYAENSSVY